MKYYHIPIFVPHRGCPYDCVFCNQRRITGNVRQTTPDDVTEIIKRHLETIPRHDSHTEAAFFGGSFTGIPMSEQNALMDRVQPYISDGRICGIRLSTRPDYIDGPILENLKRHHVTAIELGVQSMSDDVLLASGRGHTAETAKAAAKLISEYGFELGLQMMTGLPGDSDERAIQTARDIIALRPACVRIYPTLVIKDTYLETMYNGKRYTPQTVDEAAELSKKLLLMFEAAGINVIRIGLQPTEEIAEGASVVAGPFHSAFGEIVESRIYYDAAAAALSGATGDAVIYVNPGEISKMVGQKRSNILRLQKETGIAVTVKGDAGLKKREVRCVAVKKNGADRL